MSVLAIDMFTMTEEKLQDQLTKTMSVAFEGMVEMGGAALETRRLTVRLCPHPTTANWANFCVTCDNMSTSWFPFGSMEEV